MKGYKRFWIVFALLLTAYIVAEVNKPQPLDWSVSLSKDHKKPYGSFILYNLLPSLFPKAVINAYHSPAYAQINNYKRANSAYILLTPELKTSSADAGELLQYVSRGNYVFASAYDFGAVFSDTLQVQTRNRISFKEKDSAHINLLNPALRSAAGYTFYAATIDEYFSKFDTGKTVLLGENDKRQANFIKIKFGKGAFFLHANPLCFSNYFMLHNDNSSYVSKVLSYLPGSVTSVFWDEYYKSGRHEAETPLRFFLSNEYLRWALRLVLAGLLLYTIFEAKRKQRVIPVLEPFKNTTVNFIKTVAGVYFNERDNRAIANKKIVYFFEFLRHRFGINMNGHNDDLVKILSKKSDIDETFIRELVQMIDQLAIDQKVNEKLLLTLNNRIDQFYKKV